MFCNECGESVPEGSRFCLECGARLPAASTVTPPFAVAAPPAPVAEQPGKKDGGFFSSPAGIVLVVIIGVAVVAGITLGIIFALKGGSSDSADAETVKAWNEYESLADQDGTNLTTITYDAAGLAKSQEDVKKSQAKLAELQKVLEENAGTEARRAGNASGNNARDAKVDQMVAILTAYNTYLTKLDELFGTLKIANLLDPNTVNTLNAQLDGLKTIANKVKSLAEKFLADNNQVATETFEPSILDRPASLATEIQKNVQAAQAAEQQRLATEKAAADQAAAAAAAAAAAQQQEEAQRSALVTCPNCGGTGYVEGGNGRFTCPMCGGTGRVTRDAAANYNPADWYF